MFYGDQVMLTVYFGQLTHTLNGINQNRRFPLACGLIAEYLKSKLKSKVVVDVFKTPTELNKAMECTPPNVLLLSNYMWNEQLSCTFARQTRKKFPDALIIMGGPNFSLNFQTNVRFLKENPAIDKIVFHDGEIVTSIIVEEFLKLQSRNDVRRLKLPNTLSLLDNDIVEGCRSTNLALGLKDNETRLGLKNVAETLNNIPSPYLSGLLDKFFLDGEVPLIETSRGCPFKCSFCQQGAKYFSKIRNFDTKRIVDEVNYIGRKIHDRKVDINTLCVADANLAMYSRDFEIFEGIKLIQDKYGFPKSVICSTGKNRPELIIKSASVLEKGSILLRSAMQSLNKPTLDAVNRSNINLDSFKKIQDEMNEHGLESNADMMLGLPEETRELHFQGMFELIDSGIKEIACLQTIALKGTELEKEEYIAKYGIKIKQRVIPECHGQYRILGENIDVVEKDQIIVGNNSLSFDDYLSCRKLHLIIMIFHNTRLLTVAYAMLDKLNIPRSRLVKAIYDSEIAGFGKLIGAFLDETRQELFDNNKDIMQISNFEKVISNKIFRYLSLALYQHKEVIERVLHKALIDVSVGCDDADEVVRLFGMSVVSPFDKITERHVRIESHYLQQCFGGEVLIYLTDIQKALLVTLNKVFRSKEDKINRMAYHLKPANLSMHIKTNEN